MTYREWLIGQIASGLSASRDEVRATDAIIAADAIIAKLDESR